MRVTMNSTVDSGSPETIASPGAATLIAIVKNVTGAGGSIFVSNGTETVEVYDGYTTSLPVPGAGNLTLWTDGVKIRRSPGAPTVSEYLRIAEVSWGAATA